VKAMMLTFAAGEYLKGDYKPVPFESITGIPHQPLSVICLNFLQSISKLHLFPASIQLN
jgi:hypothetical protein